MGKKGYNLGDIDLDNMAIWERAIFVPLLIIYIFLVAVITVIFFPLIIVSDGVVYLVKLIFYKKKDLDNFINYYDNRDYDDSVT